ncbi:MAG: methyl-accepting chemotaxis protein [Acidaminobacteraceae bacterium]
MNEKHKRLFLVSFALLIVSNIVGFLAQFLLGNLIISGFITLLVTVLLAFFLSKLLSKSMTKIESLVDKISKNDLMTKENNSEFRGIDSTFDKLDDVIDEMKGNFRNQVDISVEITGISEKLVSVVNGINDTMEQITTNTDITSNNSEKQFEMLQNSKNEMEDIVKTLDTLKTNMNDTVSYTTDTINATKEGINSTAKILSNMSQIRDLVYKIGKDVNELKNQSDEVINLNKMVNEIAEQTNLLALNASIEAARAGEHGRGFAIVATEVSKLSQETNQVSSKIKDVITTLQLGLVSIDDAVKEDIVNVEEGYEIIETTINDFNGIKDSLEKSVNLLDDMNTVIVRVNQEGKNVSKEIIEVTKFSEEITSQMQEAASQIMLQNAESSKLLNYTENLNLCSDKLVQFVANKVMTGKMIADVKAIEIELRDVNITNDKMESMSKKYAIDVVYVTDTNGVVRYCNEEQAIGLNLYAIDPSYGELRSGKSSFIATPIKARIEDGKLFKFLSILNAKGQVYQVGLALETLQKI